jgi:hypothetical protein
VPGGVGEAPSPLAVLGREARKITPFQLTVPHRLSESSLLLNASSGHLNFEKNTGLSFPHYRKTK